MNELETNQTLSRTDDTLVESDLLVEEVSIDGMCGVY
ncbi:mycofactocin precursor MftA [Nocardia sp. CWNU-33]